MEYINRTVFIKYLSCPTLGWMTKRDMLPRLKGLNNEFLAFEGRNVRKISRQLFPYAVSAKKLNTDATDWNAKELILDPNVKTICGASFVAAGYLAKTDILHKLENNLWHLFEVKSGSKYKIKYVEDISFAVMVLAKAGVNVGKTTILHLSNDYRLGMEISSLFTKLDCSDKVELRVQEFSNLFDKVLEDVNSENMPSPYLKRSCKNCPVFDVCMGKDVKNHIFDIPRLSVPVMEELITLGADTIDKIPDNFELTRVQSIVKTCALTNTNYVSKSLKSELENIKQPFYYLDFESVTTIMPLYPDIAPHTQLLTQFSLDKTDAFGNITNHYEYIADQTRDCRHDIAEKLIESLSKEGSIITYANAEKIVISNLAEKFADLHNDLKKIIERIIDLELIIRKNYYDMNFHGRSSIKKVLPILIPEMSYTDLEIGEGGDASAAFAFMAMGIYDEKKIEETKKNLLKYCAKDTLAMVRMHQFLINIANKSNDFEFIMIKSEKNRRQVSLGSL
jgi:CRISPR/Cas system-associated exonuclease Cas4 (RecB family)